MLVDRVCVLSASDESGGKDLLQLFTATVEQVEELLENLFKYLTQGSISAEDPTLGVPLISLFY